MFSIAFLCFSPGGVLTNILGDLEENLPTGQTRRQVSGFFSEYKKTCLLGGIVSRVASPTAHQKKLGETTFLMKKQIKKIK